MTKLSEYYTKLTSGVGLLQAALDKVIVAASQAEDPDLDATDFSQTAANVETAISQLQTLLAAHRFERVSQSQLLAVFRAFDEGNATGKIIVPIDYTVSSADTWRSIEQRFGISWQAIADYNQMQSSDLTAGGVIQIPFPVVLTESVAKNILVFGDQSGYNILGADLPSSVEALNGDLKVLEPKDSFAQHMQNMAVTDQGGLPFYESYGLDTGVGEDFPPDTVEATLQVKIASAITADPRVKEIEFLTVERDPENPTAVTASVQIVPLQGLPIILTKAL